MALCRAYLAAQNQTSLSLLRIQVVAVIDSESDSEGLDPKLSSPKKPRTTSHKRPMSHSLTSKRKYNKKKIFLCWSTVKEYFVKCAKNEEESFKELEEHGLLSLSITGRKQ